jgi:phosphoserine phosphatase
MKIEILLLRHGETDWNTANRLQGQRDIPLNSTGVRQARAVADRLRETPIDRAYSSPLIRASQTAKILLGDRALALQLVTDLQEIHHGDWEGSTDAELAVRYPYEYALWQDNPLACRKPNGETIEQLADRAARRWQSIVRQSIAAGCQTVLVVCHKVTIQTILCHIEGIDLENFRDFPQDNCALNLIHYSDGNFQIEATNLNLWAASPICT